MKALIEWFIEFFLIFIHFPSNLIKPFVPLDSLNSRGDATHPIILVERWFSRNVFHIAAKKYLESKGYTVYSLNYPMLKGSFEDSAKNLEKFMFEKNIQNAILIGISAGATTCLEYLQFLNGWGKAKLFISIGGSLYGSPLARFFPFSKSLRQLIPKSAYMQHLHSEKIKHLKQIITIRAKQDSMVPVKYSRINGARSIEIDVVGHNLLHTFWMPTYKVVDELAKSRE